MSKNVHLSIHEPVSLKACTECCAAGYTCSALHNTSSTTEISHQQRRKVTAVISKMLLKSPPITAILLQLYLPLQYGLTKMTFAVACDTDPDWNIIWCLCTPFQRASAFAWKSTHECKELYPQVFPKLQLQQNWTMWLVVCSLANNSNFCIEVENN